MTTPNLWKEAVARSVAVEVSPRRTFNPGFALVAMALLLAALAGTVAVGALMDDTPGPVEIVTYDNGLMAATLECGGLIVIDPTSYEASELRAASGCQDGPWVESPVWSSDGSRLAYLLHDERDPSVAGIRIYETTTGVTRRLDACRDELCGSIGISADGTLISHVAYPRDGTVELVISDVESGELGRLDLVGPPRSPSFSPDGRRIAMSLFGGKSGVYLVDISRVREGRIGEPTLLSGIVDADEITWSPDGRWLAYRQAGGLGEERGEDPFNGQIGHSRVGIVVARADGSETRVLATSREETGPWAPTWSADSASVAFVITQFEGAIAERWMLELWTASIDGGDPTLIYESDCCKDGFAPPEWSPDGEWIAFGVNLPDAPSESGTFLVRPDGSDLRRVSDEMLAIAWQPIPRE